MNTGLLKYKLNPPKTETRIAPNKGIKGIFFSKKNAITTAIKVAIIKGVLQQKYLYRFYSNK